MIQDIAPTQLNIDYKDQVALGDDRLIIFSGDDLLIKSDHSSQRAVDFPKVKDFFKSDEGLENLQYLFEVDGVNYHLYRQDQGPDDRFKQYSFIHKRELFGDYENVFGMIVFTAAHLSDWYENNRFCGRCGGLNVHKVKDRALYCPSCELVKYPQINPVVIVAIYDKDKILLTKYAHSAYDRYALVAGFVEVGESFEQAVKREVMEEVGLRVKNIEYYKSQPWGITGGLMAGYFAEVDGDNTIRLDLDELKEGTWLTREEMPTVYENEKSLTRTMMYEWYKNK